MPFNDFVAISFYPFFIAAAPEAAFQWEFQFVVLFIHQDYDRLWDTIKANAPEFFIAWRDCGLLDERGEALLRCVASILRASLGTTG